MADENEIDRALERARRAAQALREAQRDLGDDVRSLAARVDEAARGRQPAQS